MWDVKSEQAKKMAEELGSFTLTMWDVKFNKKVELTKMLLKFYLNYVGCKALI